MPKPYFQFKQFTIFHDKCAMKVGIDAVLLGVWASVDKAKEILDIGTGSGLIALMLAQRNPNSFVDAIDIDTNAILQATENVNQSPWPNRISMQQISLQQFALTSKKRYDLIVSNPPYFINSLKAPSESRTNARHTELLTHEELIENAIKLLHPEGRICIILPVNEGMECIDFTLKNGLTCSKRVVIFPKPTAGAKRLLLEFCLQKGQTDVSELVIESEERHHYSPEFTELAKNFYLKL
ncbi:MAG: methyltransferase [Paludibacter sp.]|nr:methyltransferase [Paludibacter sp.]